MKLEQIQDDLMNEIEKAINTFSLAMPEVEQQVYKRMLSILKDMEIKNGVVLNNYNNLKLIGLLEAEIQNAVLSPKYIKSVQEFIKAFSAVAAIQIKYFKAMYPNWNPGKIFKELQMQAMNAVVESLTKSGIKSGIVMELQDMLRRNITGGVSFQSLSFQVQEYIVSAEVGSPGRLMNIASQIVTDSLNQFSAQYAEIVTSDLGLFWRMYVGSNKKTTREYCFKMKAKKFVFEKEMQSVARGIVDGVQVKINPKTDLWYGAIEGTDISNLPANRGGWRCGHQFPGVMEGVVPLQIRVDTYNKFNIPHNNGKKLK